MPSLNERIDDIPLLANHFINDICSNQGKPALPFTEEAVEELKKVNWTGNIRELRNVVERLSILCDKTVEKNDVIKYVHPIKY